MVEVTVLGSGSRGNATAIRCGREVVLVDVGFSAVEMQRRLVASAIDPGEIVALLLTHEHDDHVKGLRVFADRHELPAFANALTAERLRGANHAPERVFIFRNGLPFTVGPFQIEAHSVSHDAVDPVAFSVSTEKRRIAIATDFGHAGKMLPLKLGQADLLVLESNHDPQLLRASNRPPRLQQRILSRRGHLSNQGAVELLPKLVGEACRHVVMAHLSQDCNRPELVDQGVRQCLHELQRDGVHVTIAQQEAPCEPLAV